MNTIIANFVSAVAAQTFVTLILFVVIFWFGFWRGRKTAVPFRKTRYFVDEYNRLRRWKFGQTNTEIIWSGTCWQWFQIRRSLSYMLKNYQEIDSLTAYRLFPNAFPKKKEIVVPEPEPKQKQSIFNVVDNWTHSIIYSGSRESCVAYLAKVKSLFQTDGIIVQA